MVDKKCLLLVLFVLTIVLTLPAVYADSEVFVETVKNQISPLENAEYTLTIKNYAAETQRFSLYSFAQGWSVDPFPLRNRIMELGPGQTKSTTVRARAIESFPPGIYYLTITIESDLGERQSKPLKVYLTSDKAVDYLPSIRASLDMDEKINPKDPVSIKLSLDNLNPKNLSDLTIKIQSDIPEFSKEVTVNLPPLKKKTVEFSVIPNKFQQPKDYILFFVLQKDGETVKVVEKRIEILQVVPDFTVKVAEDSTFLKTFASITVLNEGNVKNTQEVILPVSFWKSLFTKQDVKTKVVGKQRNFVWEATLSPNEETVFYIETNYRILFYIAVISLIFVIFYLAVRSPVVVKKRAVTTKGGDAGTLSQIKVTLEVINKTGKPIKDVTITDWVPAIANVEKSLELGTLRPKAVRNTKKGTKVVWSLAELDGHEHRLITYKVKAKLNILGTFSLPRAVLNYGKKKSYSNIYRIGGQ